MEITILRPIFGRGVAQRRLGNEVPELHQKSPPPPLKTIWPLGYIDNLAPIFGQGVVNQRIKISGRLNIYISCIECNVLNIHDVTR